MNYEEDAELQRAIQASLESTVNSKPKLNSHLSKLIHINNCFQVVPILKPDKENIGKLILPHYIIRYDLKAGKSLGTSENPVIFKLTSLSPKSKLDYVYLGLLEFHQDDSNMLYIPNDIITQMGIEIGSMVKLQTLEPNMLPKADFIQLQPIECTFTTLPDPRQLLEDFLNQNFTTLSLNQQLTIKHKGQEYHLFIKELKSDNMIVQDADITNIDLNLDFETPVEELNLQAEKERQEAEAKAKSEEEAKKAEEEARQVAQRAEKVLKDNSKSLSFAEQMSAIRAMRAKERPQIQSSDLSSGSGSAFTGLGQSVNGKIIVQNPVSISEDIASECDSDTESESASDSE